jgi:hypothetical protein
VLRYQTAPGVALKPKVDGAPRRLVGTLFPGRFLELKDARVRSAGGAEARVTGQRDACRASILLLDGIVLFS